MEHSGHQGILVPMSSCTEGVDTLLVHPHPPTHLGLLICHPPTHASLPVKGVGPTGGRGTVGGTVPIHWPHIPRSFGIHHPRICSGPARCVTGRGQCGSYLPFPVRPDGKGRETFPSSTSLCMWGEIGWGPPSYLVGGRPREMESGSSSHPESGPDAGPGVLSPG